MPKVDWTDFTAPELRTLAAKDATVILPVASMEQHGPHLPVQVDTLLGTEVARIAARRLADEMPVVVAPTVWSGLAEHHMALGGTFTLDFATFHALLRCLCHSLLRHGFRRIVLTNAHGGNETALNVVANELARELGTPVATATYWKLAADAFKEILEAQPNVRHACEAETSMVLALRPELVDMEAARALEPTMEGPAGRSRLYRFRSFAGPGYTADGVIGAPAAASAEKGRRLLDAAGEALAVALREATLWE